MFIIILHVHESDITHKALRISQSLVALECGNLSKNGPQWPSCWYSDVTLRPLFVVIGHFLSSNIISQPLTYVFSAVQPLKVIHALELTPDLMHTHHDLRIRDASHWKMCALFLILLCSTKKFLATFPEIFPENWHLRLCRMAPYSKINSKLFWFSFLAF